MKERLANVIHWFGVMLGCGWAALCYFLSTAASRANDPSIWWAMIGGFAVLWFIGWTINYVLTGRTSFLPD